MGKTRRRGQQSRKDAIEGMTQAQYARRRGVSRSTIARAIAAGRIPFLKRSSRIDVKKADRAWLDNTDPMKQRGRHARDGKESDEDPKLYLWKARRERSLAGLARLELQERRGQLIRADEVQKVAFERGRRTRDQLLAIPDQIADRLVGIDDRHEVHRILTEELRKVAEDMANNARGEASEPAPPATS